MKWLKRIAQGVLQRFCGHDNKSRFEKEFLWLQYRHGLVTYRVDVHHLYQPGDSFAEIVRVLSDGEEDSPLPPDFITECRILITGHFPGSRVCVLQEGKSVEEIRRFQREMAALWAIGQD